MIVLRAIGRFFARIGRWIRDTAWVQPLLIVGGIFAVIFSIPHITTWVKSWFKEGNAAEKYYSSHDLSFSGIEKGTSEVNQMFEYLEAYENNDAAGIAKGENKFGKKFFLAFVQEGCEDCESNYKGFKVLKDNWGKNEFSFNETYKKETFKIHTIYIDKTNDKGDNLFQKYIQKEAKYDDIFETAAALKNPYLDNGHVTSYDSVHDKVENFVSPTTFLVDMVADERVTWDYSYGITEITFQIKGRDGNIDDYSKARTIWDCWNHQGIFSESGESFYVPNIIK
jgi:hypothetical protein